MTSFNRVLAVALASTAAWVVPAVAKTVDEAKPQTGSSAAPAADPSIAQSSPAVPQDQTADQGALGDIIVTATKVETRLQDTPIAIRAVTGEALTKAAITDVTALQRIAPDLGIAPNTIFTTIAIRGVSSVDVGETADPALTIGIDGEYINRPVSLNASFFDLDRIEVLRGPQGTLFGRNSTAGALNIVAAKPKLRDFGGYATFGYGNYNSIYATAALNVPIGDTVAVRIAGLHTSHDGYFYTPPAGRSGDGNTTALRASIYACCCPLKA